MRKDLNKASEIYRDINDEELEKLISDKNSIKAVLLDEKDKCWLKTIVNVCV